MGSHWIQAVRRPVHPSRRTAHTLPIPGSPAAFRFTGPLQNLNDKKFLSFTRVELGFYASGAYLLYFENAGLVQLVAKSYC